MSKERDLLSKAIELIQIVPMMASIGNVPPDFGSELILETKELLAQPEQEPVGEDAVNKCLANAIKDGWYPVNEDSYRQGFWDAVESLEDGE